MVSAESALILIGGLISGVVAGWVLIISRDFAEFCNRKGVSKKVYRTLEILFSIIIVSLYILFIIFLID